MSEQAIQSIAHVIDRTLMTPNESDSNGECANVVDGLFAIARAVSRLATALEGVNVHEAIREGTAEAFAVDANGAIKEGVNAGLGVYPSQVTDAISEGVGNGLGVYREEVLHAIADGTREALGP